MRILVVNYEYPPIGGGGGFVTRDILEQMAKSGHGVTIITTHYKGLKKHEKVNGAEIIRVPVFLRNKMEVANIPSLVSYCPSSFLYAIHNCNRHSYDVINTHFTIPSGPTGHLLSKISGLPNILSIHGGDIFDPSKTFSPHRTPLLHNVVEFLLTKANLVVAQSSDTRENAYKYYNINREIKIIPLGIKKPVFEKKTRYHFDLEPDELVFCTIGRLIKRKNIDDELEVLSRIKKHFRFKFLIIGEGPERAHLERLARHLGLQGIVRFLGNVSDEVKFQLLDLSDCYLSTALHEGFGLVFLEAMESGLPVISYNRGGQNDFLASGKTGFLVELGNKESFGRKVIELIRNAELRNSMSSHNRDLVKKYYISNCAEKYVRLFEDLASRHRFQRKHLS